MRLVKELLPNISISRNLYRAKRYERQDQLTPVRFSCLVASNEISRGLRMI